MASPDSAATSSHEDCSPYQADGSILRHRGRRFVSVPYALGPRNRLVPSVVIEVCPLHVAAEKATPCRLTRNGFRWRENGPGFPLQILRCHSHKVYFTLYPPGYEPYSRVRLAPLDPAGHLVMAPQPATMAEESGASESSERCDDRWTSTRFLAVTDALDPALGLWSPEKGETGERPCRRTQRRWTAFLLEILGLAVHLAQPLAERIAAALLVPGYEHQQARERVARAVDLRARAAAILVVLALMPLDDEVFARLMGAGCLAGVWESVLVWDPKTQQLVFPVRGTQVPPPGRDPP